MRRVLMLVGVMTLTSSLSFAQTGSPITYAVSFPEPEHHWMQVEVTFPNLGTAPLQARMSRSSPGRYAVHEFAKNVFWVEAFGGKGQKLQATRPDPSQWTAPVKILDGGGWYPQVIGMEAGTGTDRIAGKRARFFLTGRSDRFIEFER